MQVLPDCSVPGHPKVFVIGDAAYLIDQRPGARCRGCRRAPCRWVATSRASIIEDTQQGTRALRERGLSLRDWGSMATIGKSRAVVEIGPLRFGGLLAWLAWMFLHVSVLIGFRNRLVGHAVLDLRLRVFAARLAPHHRCASSRLARWRASLHPAGRARAARLRRAPRAREPQHAARLLRRLPLQPPRARCSCGARAGADALPRACSRSSPACCRQGSLTSAR